MIKVIYFDYHGVLDYHKFWGLLETMGKAWSFAKGKDDQLFLQDFLEQEQLFGYEYATGTIAPAVYWKHISDTYGPAIERLGRQYLLHVQPNRDMWNMVNTLHQTYETGLFSDCSLDKKEVIRSAYALTEFFDYLIFSADVKRSKQQPEFFKFMLQNGKFQPDECLMIDDAPANVNLAQSLGFRTHLYHDVPTFKAFIDTLHA